MELTAKQVRAYLKASGTWCPFCRSPQIEGGPVEIDARGARQTMTCLACGRTWQDVHQRVDIIIEQGEQA